jgi:hypothetical protein
MHNLSAPNYVEKLFGKSRKPPRLGSHEWAKGLEKPNCAVLCHRTYTIETPSAIFQTVSEGEFSELPLKIILGSSQLAMLPSVGHDGPFKGVGLVL